MNSLKKDNISNKLSSDTELNYIFAINRQLYLYENKLKSIDNNEYKSIITSGKETCELMLELFLRKEEYSINKITSIIKYSINTNLIPKKYKDILFKIEVISNNTSKLTYNKVYEFLMLFDSFTVWFSDFYTKKYSSKLIKIENCHKLINSLENHGNTSKIKVIDKDLTKKKILQNEKNYIKKINNSLKTLEKHLDLMTDEIYTGPVIEGNKICEQMLSLYLKKEGYNVNASFVIINDRKIPVIGFCSQNNIFPAECREFLEMIKKYRNQFAHSNPTYDLAVSFLKALSYFLLWFNNFYSMTFNTEKPFKIEKCYFKINKITNFSNYKLDTLDNFSFNSKKILQKVMECKIDFKPKNFNLEQNQNLDFFEILFKTSNNSEILKTLLLEIQNIKSQLDTIEEQGINIQTTLTEIKQQLVNLSIQINGYQSMIEKQIKTAISEDEIDRIIKGFADECAEIFVEQTNNIKDEQEYAKEKTKLILLFGDDAWNKLSEESKTFLISSKIMYSNFITINEIIDYSGICILITKALEVEMYNRFFKNFIKYLDKNYNENYSEYPTALLYKNKTPIFYDKFTMGNIPFVLQPYKNRYDTVKQKENNKRKLIEYCKSCIFSNYSDNEIENLLNQYANSIEEIRIKYRNPSAHRNEIKRIDAKNCFDLLIDVEKLLKEMLDSFDE